MRRGCQSRSCRDGAHGRVKHRIATGYPVVVQVAVVRPSATDEPAGLARFGFGNTAVRPGCTGLLFKSLNIQTGSGEALKERLLTLVLGPPAHAWPKAHKTVQTNAPHMGMVQARLEQSSIRRIFGSLLELASALNQWPLSIGKAMVAFMGQPSIGLCWPIVTPVVLTPSASRPTENSGGLASYSGDASCVDAISFKTYGKLRWSGFIFRHTGNSAGLASYSGDASCVDAISFKTYGKLRDVSCVDVISFKTYGQLRWPGFILK
ncbi:hypothetical protein Taro_047080 [Colocasia esculenta]|uniref:Uncharacterized protein n=1 Tax=Colocasia esculenta TaxID=4460 RepID=A0A843WVB1_COLES|nr:hypothetical protein [Colocasia esculenta]